MIRGRKILVLAAGGLLCGLQVHGLAPDSAGNPYTGIADRNVFQLKPPVVSPPTNNKPVIPPSKLTLTGITTILGNKGALLSAQLPPRPPEPAKLESYMLTEGQRDGGIEVLSIDEKNGVVKVDNNGVEETLDFVNNGAKLVAFVPPPGTPPGGVVPLGFSRPAVPPPIAPNQGIRTSSQQPGTLAQGGQNPGPGGYGGSYNSAAVQPIQNHVTPEVQTIMIEAQRMDLQQQGKHEEAALFPMTELTPNPDVPSPAP